uniref:Uncharacterized protein n=1 Tax=Fagus sylvatica TaxID=28930 RepID=A0A2N9GC22_FAGSY
MAPRSRGVGAVFACFSGEDSGQTRDAIGEPRVPRRSWSHHLSNVPGFTSQLVACRKDSAREGGCPGEKMRFVLSALFLKSCPSSKACATYFCKVPDLRESELGSARYGSANRGRRGVFGPLEDNFPIRIQVRPGKILAIREFRVVHECVFFPTCPGLRINLLRVRKTLCASVATSVGKFQKFQHNLISSACFYARGRRSSRYRILTILVSSESLRYLLFNGTGLVQRRAWVTQDMILRTEAVGIIGLKLSTCSTHRSSGGQFDSAFGLVNGSVKLGQPWSNLVKLGQNSLNPGKRILDRVSRVFGHSGPRSGWKRSGQTLVKLGQPWSNLVNLREPCPGSSSWGYLMWRVLVGSGRLGSGCLVLRADTRENPVAYLGGNVCAKILSDPLQLGPRAKTLRQEAHFSYHTQLSDRQELLRSSRNLSQKLTPWHKEHSDGLRSQDHISRTQSSPLCKACTVKKVFLTRNKLICEPGHIGKRTHPCTTWNSRIAKNLSGSAGIPIGKLPSNGPKTPRWTLLRGAISHKSKLGFPRILEPCKNRQRKLSDGTKNVKIRHRELGQICARTGTRFEKKRAGSKTHFFSRTAAFARRVFPARNKLIREPGCVGKIMTPATSWNSRFADSIPRLTGILHRKSAQKQLRHPDFREP